MGKTDFRGFTLIELVITMAVLAILAMMAIPNMSAWIANSKVRTVAESLQNDLRTAQGEALKRSHQVVFVLTGQTALATGTTAYTPSTSGNNWYTDVLPVTDSEDAKVTVVQVNEIGSQYGTTISTSNSGAAFSALCFNSEGRLASNTSTNVGADCTIPSGTNLMTFDVSLSGSDRPLRVEVQQGGKVRVCDPSQTLSSDSPTGCAS